MSMIIRMRTLRQAAAVIALSILAGNSFAHIKNEASQFPDIEFSEARFDIVVLVGAGIVPETPVFEPDKPLSKRELATWAALARGLADGGETPDTDALATAALEEGIVESLQGDATYGDVNALFFDDQLSIDNATDTPNKGQAASFIASRLDTDAGRALLERHNLRAGSTGKVASVETRQGHHGGNAYVITIGDVSRQMHEHGRVANGPTDLLQWNERTVRRSFVSGDGEDAVWIYLEAEPREPVARQTVSTTDAGNVAEESQTDHKLLYWLIAAVVILGLILFVRRRRRD